MTEDKKANPPRPGKGRGDSPSRHDRDVGAALRAAYKRTVEENVPQELLDLLGKLS